MNFGKRFVYYIFFVCILVSFSCAGPKYEKPIQDPQYLLRSFDNFWNYWNKEVKLSRNFISLDENETVITKNTFLEKLALGEYLPLRLKSNDSINYYKLYKINDGVNNDISNTIKACGNVFYQKYKLVDKQLPGFDFTDLNGSVFNRESCKGKIVVLNCWFVNCLPCVAELPVLNKLVDLYKNREDIIFVSLALDSPTRLRAFLAKTNFSYAVVPDMAKYLKDVLNIPAYPAHIIVDRNGVVVSVPEDHSELEIELRRETKLTRQ